MALFRRKPKFIFEFSGCDQFREEEIHDPYELVKLMTEEDTRFRRDYHQGYVTVTKVKNDVKGRVYYEERFYLPQNEDFDWLAALSSFFTKKPLTYILEEPSLPEETESVVKDEGKQTAQPYTLDEFETSLQTEAVPKETRAASTDETTNEGDSIPSQKKHNTPIEKEVVQLTRSEFEELQRAIQEQKNETERLREEMKRQEITPKVASLTPLSEEMKTVSTVADLFESEERQTSSGEAVKIVPDVLLSTKTELDQALSQFLKSESSKIETEIQCLDKRDQIVQIVTEKFKKEEQDRLDLLKREQAARKEQSIQEEQLRHKKKLEEIDFSYDQQLQEEVVAIQMSFKEKISTCIKEEYDKQTIQLTRILQGKMDELQLQQQAINDGLKANIQEALEKFNQKHNQVIQEVERKKQVSPIDLEQQRKLKQA